MLATPGTETSETFDVCAVVAARRLAAVQLFACLLLLAGQVHSADSDYLARVDRVLAGTPLIDGHNDLAWEIRVRFGADLKTIDLKSDTSRLPTPEGNAPLMTDIPRLRAGHVVTFEPRGEETEAIVAHERIPTEAMRAMRKERKHEQRVKLPPSIE